MNNFKIDNSIIVLITLALGFLIGKIYSMRNKQKNNKIKIIKDIKKEVEETNREIATRKEAFKKQIKQIEDIPDEEERLKEIDKLFNN